MKFNEITSGLQSGVKEYLKAFDDCSVVFEYGVYKVGLGTCIKLEYGKDHKVIGRYFANEVFTEDERIVNYVESFHDYPINYKGNRDYAMLKTMTWETKVELKNGNIVIK